MSDSRHQMSSIHITGDTSWLVLPVGHPEEYERQFPLFKKPKKLGIFSVDGCRQFLNDDRNKKYLWSPILKDQPKLDLNKGFETAIRKTHFNYERLNLMLQYISSNIGCVKTNLPPRSSGEIFGADFVCYRGLLTAIANTPYESQDDWIIGATKFKGTIYLCAFYTEQKIQSELNSTPLQNRMSYWGYKFEQYMLSDSPDEKPRPNDQLNENEEFCVTVKGQLCHHSLLFSGEMDGIDLLRPCSHNSTENYVELKTSRQITSRNQHRNFCRHKMRKYWIQSFLIGIPKVYCGFRDDNGIVQEIHGFSTREFPKMGQDFWSASSMMNFLNVFLSFVKKCVVKDDPRLTYKFRWKPGHDIVGEELYNAQEYQILPDWYIAYLEKYV